MRSGIESTLVDEPPLVTTDGGVVRAGCHSGLDELRDLARGGKQWIAEYQKREIERTGISSLKVGFNKVFGYYLEVTAANRDKVPSDYTRKQTLKNQERFITPELKEYEERVLRAEEQAVALEQELFDALRKTVAEECRRLQQTADVLAQLDVLAGLASLAVKQRYCRPVVVQEPVLEIRDGRHPVLDRVRPGGEFVPNDIVLGRADTSDPSLKVESGDSGSTNPQPSTLDPQPQLIAGSPARTWRARAPTSGRRRADDHGADGFVRPASSARIGLPTACSRGSAPATNWAARQSTFMVEMTETARILNAATERSLVILDEIGRGTSTWTASRAWAVTEYLHDHKRCRTLFATHYHELTDLPKTLPQSANWNVAVLEQSGDVIFLHKIVPGAADRSYGIHVARLAGVPRDVIERASVILDKLEADHHDEAGRTTIPARKRTSRQLSLFVSDQHPLLDEIKSLKLEEMTPLHALEELHRLQRTLATEPGSARGARS